MMGTDADFHAPNEFFGVQRLHERLQPWARYRDVLAEVRA